MLIFNKPKTLNDADAYVSEFDLTQAQVNFLNHNSTRLNPKFSNRIPPHQNNHTKHIFTPQPSNSFPRNSMNIQPKPVQKYIPTNAQVFGKPKNLLAKMR